MILRKKPKASQYNGNNLDKKLVSNLAKARIPNFKQLKYINKYLNKTEITALYIAIVIAIVGTIFLVGKFYNQNLEVRPEVGGKYIEGVVGAPKYINPLYASLNDVDADIASLIYSSLFTRDINGQLIPNLVTKYKISTDQKSYSLTIRDDVQWHDGEALTVDDIIFTFNSFKNTQYKSALRYVFNGVEISKLNKDTIQFVLQEPYALFLDLLTFGILPKNLWQDITPNNMALAELNLKPIGSGPYKFKVFSKDKNGNIKNYILEANQDYYQQVPYLKEIDFKFFVSPEEMLAALNNNKVDAVSYLPLDYQQDIIAVNSFNFYQLNWPQLTGLFFNHTKELVSNKIEVKQALAYAINKAELITDVLNGQAQILNGPIISSSQFYSDAISKYSYNPTKAKELLSKLGYKLTVIDKKSNLEPGTWMIKDNKIFTINITVANDKLNTAVANKLANYWQAIGIKTEIKTVTNRELQTKIIPTKNFNIILDSFKDSINPDPYPFWHSSQKQGLNISGYQQTKVDKLLETARTNSDPKIRLNNLVKFQKIITLDLPVIFLYSPNYVYIQNKRIKGFQTKTINNPADRFSNITNWYTKESKKLNL